MSSVIILIINNKRSEPKMTVLLFVKSGWLLHDNFKFFPVLLFIFELFDKKWANPVCASGDVFMKYSEAQRRGSIRLLEQ